jgi:hypothetical protein
MWAFRFCFVGLAALGLAAGCAASGDPPPGSNASAGDPAKTADPAKAVDPAKTSDAVPGPAGPSAVAGAPVETRDVAVLVLVQTPSALRVTSSARRPRSAFGPAASWNGTGTPTHRWVLRGVHGEEIASGDIVARGVIEAPPNPAQGATGVHVKQEGTSFTVKVPQPGAGEAIEITSVSGSGLAARWP